MGEHRRRANGTGPADAQHHHDDGSLEDEVHALPVAALPWQEAWLLAGRLKSEGIPARVYPDYYASPIVAAQAIAQTELAAVGLGRTTFEVMVPERFAVEARRIVREVNGG